MTSPPLPALLQEIADAVGEALRDPAAGIAAALQVARARGGQRVYIPVRPGADHWLVVAAGERAAAAIARHFTTGDPPKGAELEIPLGPSGSYREEQRRRARLIGEALACNLPANEAAARAGISRRAVFYAKARRRGPDRQMRLFDED